MDDINRSFQGTGWAFPMRVDGRGGIALVSEDQAIRRAIQIILSTAKGERRMRPHFGCAIHDLVFAPNDVTTVGLIRYHVMEALGWWEPRITVTDVEVDTDPDDPARLLVVVHYIIKSTNDERSLVYPFYRIPGEG
ncbi:MAG TPA: GPW/gp25 family protein [Chloroflexota bacterium]|jgi:phage baseplate assembly protein W|nr:GPW/gp25 family protein [Chloroflexota bacterium]